MLRRSCCVHGSSTASAPVSGSATSSASAAVAGGTSSCASLSSSSSPVVSGRRKWWCAVVSRFGCATGVVWTAWTVWWYSAIYRPRALLVDAVVQQKRPVRTTKVFTTGTESISSVSDLASNESYKFVFFLRSFLRLLILAWRSSFVAWLLLKYWFRRRLLGNAEKSSSGSDNNNSNSSTGAGEHGNSNLPEEKKHQIQRAVQIITTTNASSSGKKDDDDADKNANKKKIAAAATATTTVVAVDDPDLVLVGKEVAEIFNRMGGAYVKLGQWSATRSDIFPKEICDALERLFDKTTPHPWEETEKMLREANLLVAPSPSSSEFGEFSSDAADGGGKIVFESFDREPVSSGTIAQVYRAKLKRNVALDDKDHVNVFSSMLRAQQLQDHHRSNNNHNNNNSSSNNGTSNNNSGLSSNNNNTHFTEDEQQQLQHVAVKVSHPGIRLLILQDMQALQWATQLINLIVPGASYLGMTNAVEEFAGLLYSQLDLLREAENLNEFRYNFRTSETVVFPRPFLSLTTSKVLVESFEYGVALNSQLVSDLTGLDGQHPGFSPPPPAAAAAAAAKDKYDKTPKQQQQQQQNQSTLVPASPIIALSASSSERPGPHEHLSFPIAVGGSAFQTPSSPLQKSDYADLGPLAIDMFLKMVFEHNLVHGDLHPGNILIRIANTDGSYSLWRRGPHSHSQVVVLDPGLVTSMSARERNNFIALFTCVATGDGDLGAKLMLERSPEQHCANVPSYMRDMKSVFEKVTPRGLKIEDLDLATIMREILETMRQHRVRIDMNFASLAATVALGESLGRRLVPDFNMFDEAMPFLLRCLETHELKYMIGKLTEVTWLEKSSYNNHNKSGGNNSSSSDNNNSNSNHNNSNS